MHVTCRIPIIQTEIENEEQGDKAIELAIQAPADSLIQGLCRDLERTAEANAMQRKVSACLGCAISPLAKVSEMHRVKDYRVMAENPCTTLRGKLVGR